MTNRSHITTAPKFIWTIPDICPHPGLWSQGTVFHSHQHTESRSGEDTRYQQWFNHLWLQVQDVIRVLEVACYLCSVSTGKAEFNDEHRLRGDDGVRGGVGRRSDHRVCAALPCHHTMQTWAQLTCWTKMHLSWKWEWFTHITKTSLGAHIEMNSLATSLGWLASEAN